MSASSATLARSGGGARLRPLARAVAAQTRAELTMTFRRGETLLITVIVPAVLLVFFAALKLTPTGPGFHAPITYLLPGILALAIMSTGMVSLGIATAYERYYGVLKRLGASPLPRGGLILAKALAVLLVEIAQTVLLVAIAVLFYGWRPAGSFWLALLVFLIGTACFAGLGMLMAGGLRAEATLAGANALYLLFIVIGDSVLPLSHLPGFIAVPASVLPAAVLTDALRGAMMGGGVAGASLALLVGWAVVFVVAASLTFKWE